VYIERLEALDAALESAVRTTLTSGPGPKEPGAGSSGDAYSLRVSFSSDGRGHIPLNPLLGKGISVSQPMQAP
jgi:hypothetical protein